MDYFTLNDPLAQSPTDGIIKVGIEKISHHRNRKMKVYQSDTEMLLKSGEYEHEGGFNIDMINIQNLMYKANVKVGNDLSSVVLDTGSSWFVVTSDLC